MTLAALFEPPVIQPKGRVVRQYRDEPVVGLWMDFLPATIVWLAEELQCSKRQIRLYVSEAVKSGKIKQVGYGATACGNGPGKQRKMWARV